MEALSTGAEEAYREFNRDASLYLPLAERIARKVADLWGTDPDDAVSASHLALAEALHTYDPSRGELKKWVLFFVRRKVMQDLRSHMPVGRKSYAKGFAPKTVALDDVFPDGTVDVYEEDPAERVTDEVVLASAIKALTISEQRLLQALYVEDASVNDAAKVLGVTPRAVRKAHARALSKLRATLGDTAEEGPPLR